MPEAALAQPPAAAAAAAALLAVRDLHGWYGESHVLHGIALDVHEGEVITLLGRNGAGKTTTLKAIMGILTKRKGFFRILYETDMVSPSAAEKHFSLIARKYAGVMRRAVDDAQIRPLSPIEIEVLTYLLMGARDYLYRYSIHGQPKDSSKIAEIVQAYISLLRNGVGAAEARVPARKAPAPRAGAEAGH